MTDIPDVTFVLSACYRVFSAYIKEIDEKPGATEWGSRMPFANLMAEFTSAAGLCMCFGFVMGDTMLSELWCCGK